ncbi:MAG: OmpH family outer membrane protein [Synergistaceae bacterium]|nr:OmpH family outer membrane protein [Synergistaceae bacterium]
MRKLVAVVVLSATLVFGFAALAMADDTIGTISAQQILLQHPKFRQVQDQLKKISEQKEKEARSAIDKEKSDQKKQEIFNKKRGELAQQEQKLMEPLLKDIDNAIKKVAEAKKLTVVLEKDATFYGGVDITKDVLAQLKK